MAKSRNFLGSIILVTTGAADTEFAVSHEMDVIPRGAFTIRANQACVLYESGTPWTSSQAFLKCNVSTASLYVLFFA